MITTGESNYYFTSKIVFKSRPLHFLTIFTGEKWVFLKKCPLLHFTGKITIVSHVNLSYLTLFSWSPLNLKVTSSILSITIFTINLLRIQIIIIVRNDIMIWFKNSGSISIILCICSIINFNLSECKLEIHF